MRVCMMISHVCKLIGLSVKGRRRAVAEDCISQTDLSCDKKQVHYCTHPAAP